MIVQCAPGFSFSWGNTGKECRGSRVAPYSETPEIGTLINERMKSISAMPQYVERSHEELRIEDYELLKESSFPCSNQGNAFQQSSSPFVPHTSPVPSSQSSTGGAFSSSPANSVLGTSSGSRTSTLGFTFAPPSERPSISPFTASISPSFGTLPRSSGGCGGFLSSSTSNNPVSTTSGFSFGSSSGCGGFPSSSTSNNPVSTTSGFGFGSSGGCSGFLSSSTSNNPVSTTSGFGFGSSGGCGGFPSSSTSNNPVSTTSGFGFGSSGGCGGFLSSSTSNNPVSTTSGFGFGSSGGCSGFPSSSTSNNPVSTTSGFGFGSSGGCGGFLSSSTSNNPVSTTSGFGFGSSGGCGGFLSSSTSNNPVSTTSGFGFGSSGGCGGFPSSSTSNNPVSTTSGFGFGSSGGCGGFLSSSTSNNPVSTTFGFGFGSSGGCGGFLSSSTSNNLVSTTSGFGFGSSGGCGGFLSSSTSNNPVSTTSGFGFGSSGGCGGFLSSSTSNNPVSTTSGFGFGSSGGCGGFLSSSTSNNPVSTTSGFGFGSSGRCGGFLSSSTSNNPVSTTSGFCFGSSSGFQSSSISNNPVSTPSGFIFGASPASGSSSVFGIKALSSSSTKFQGSRVASYSATTEVEKARDVEYVLRFQSISAMPSYNDKSHEELRFEDYGLGDKGGRVQRGFAFHTPPSSFPLPPLSNQSSVSPFQPLKSTFSKLERGNSVTSSNKISTIPLPTTSSPCIGTFPFTNPSVIFSPSIQSTPVTSSDSLPSIVAPSQPQQTAEKVGSFPINDFNKSSQGSQGKTVAKYQGSRVTPYSATTETEFDMTYSIEYIGNIQSISAVPSYNDKSHEELRLEDYRVGDKGTTLCGNPFSRSFFSERSDTQNIFPFPPSSNQSSVRSPFQPENCTTPSITITKASTLSPSANQSPKISVFPSSSEGTFSFTKPLSVQSTPVTSSDPCSSTVNESQTQQAAERSGSLPTEQYAPPSNLTMQSPLVANPFATRLPVDQPNAVTSRLHGISSLPVSDNISPNRRESLLRIRHVSFRLPGLPTRKPNGGSSQTKVPFFIDEEDKLGSAAPFIPRENPMDSINVSSLSLHSPQNSKDDEVKESSSSFNENSTSLADDEVSASTERYVADVLALLPKLPAANYYIKPSLPELAAREMAEAGFCSHVKDFVVGREGYGSIKFIGETDVRHLDIGSIVQFKDREVTVYPDEGKKPRVGQQLNKEAEVTLLNVKCIDSKTGKQYVEGHQVQSYQETLIKRIEEQGAEFVSYDPVEGEWKVMVQHF